MIRYRKKAIFFFSFFMSVSFYYPVFASYFQAIHNFTSAEITVLLACGSLSIFLFEIPTGLLGDKIGERESLMIGAGFTAISTLLFLIGNTLLIYIGEIIFGIGSTFFSGAFDSLLYQYYENNKTENYSKIVSKCYSLQWLALSFSFLGCSLLSLTGNLYLPFYATLAANIFTFISAFFLPVIEKKRQTNTVTIFTSAIHTIINNSDLRKACLLNILLSMLFVSGYHLLQPYLASSGIQMSYNGIIYCLAAFLASFGASIFDKIDKRIVSKKRLLRICILLITCCFWSLATFRGFYLIIVVICFYRFIMGFCSPTISYLINNTIPSDEYRSTIFSITSLISNLLGSALLFLLGFFEINPRTNFYVLALIALLCFLVYFTRIRRNNKQSQT